jgi:hypothetical protein
MYQDNVYRIRTYYDGAEDNFAEQSITVVAVPDRVIGPTLDVDSLSTLSTSAYSVRVRIGDMADSDVVYDQTTMGRWKVRLVEAVTAKTATPLTDWIDVDTGEGSFSLDLKGNASRTLRLMAEAKLVLPESTLDYTVKSKRALYVSIKDGAEIESTLAINSQSAPAPFNATITLSLADRNQAKEMGLIKWYVKSSTGTWQETDSIRAGSSSRFVYRYTKVIINVCGPQHTVKESCSEAGYPETDEMDVVLILPWPSGPSAPRAAFGSSTKLAHVRVHVVAVVVVGEVVVAAGAVMLVVVVVVAMVVVVVVVVVASSAVQ